MATSTTKTQKNEHEGQSMTDKAKDVAGKAAEKGKEAASTIGEKARQAGEYARDKADEGVATVGRGVENLGQTVRDKGPQSGVMGRATSAVADTLENTGEYLEEKGLSGMASDVTDLIRRNPIPAVLIGVGVGFLLARLTTRSS
jgi:ElaB/YqjD/DUF883 family membrane-anchored ribosome-binding protein